MLKKSIAIASVLALTTGPVLADHHEGGEPPPPEKPQLILGPPPETEPPEDVGELPMEAEAAKDWLTAIFFGMMDTDNSGNLTEGELRAWVDFAHIPMMPPDGGPMPPDGDGEGGDGGEEWPQNPCGDAMGNEITRDISINPGPSNVAISLPAGREAGCFPWKSPAPTSKRWKTNSRSSKSRAATWCGTRWTTARPPTRPWSSPRASTRCSCSAPA